MIPTWHIGLALEYCSQGDLCRFIEEVQSGRKNLSVMVSKSYQQSLPPQDVKRYFKQLVSGLMYLHENLKKLHRDIKPQNVLVQGSQWKISDFGLAQDINTRSRAYSRVGTPGFMAPEVFSGTGYTTPADVF
jgi:serine/threonine protein kinase